MTTSRERKSKASGSGAGGLGAASLLTSAYKAARQWRRSLYSLLRKECVARRMQGCMHAPQTSAGRVYRPREPRASAHAMLLHGALRSHPESLRAPGALRRLVLKPKPRKAPARGRRTGRGRPSGGRPAREPPGAVHLGAPDTQGLRGRSARMPHARDRPHRRRSSHPQDPQPPGSVGAATCVEKGTRAARS